MSQPDDLRDLFAKAHSAMEAEFNRVAGTDNWKMVDLPRMTNPFYEQLVTAIGEGEYRGCAVFGTTCRLGTAST
jgi:hypothetical protein